jgi:replication factor C small subunit|tara:strand:+ start:14875 stop:15786 length:912 start_codon:yes stop_codon:yes gene_type:complete
MLWTEKYRPEFLHQIKGQEHFVMDAENWIELQNMPNVLFYGVSGTGKTASGLALTRSILGEDALDNFFEINASDDRKLETVRTRIKEIAQSGGLGGVPFRIILLDEMDGMTTDAQNALKRIMERYANNVRFIITCNDRTKIIFALQSRCANYHFKPLSYNVILDVLNDILSKEGHADRFSELEMLAFIKAYEGDLRRTITELQAAVSSDKPLSIQVQSGLKDYENIMNEILNKNTKVLSQLHSLLYDGKTIKDICLGLHDVIIEAELDSSLKYKLLRVIGESEWRSTTMTPRVLLSWMVGQLI